MKITLNLSKLSIGIPHFHPKFRSGQVDSLVVYVYGNLDLHIVLSEPRLATRP